MNRRLARRSLRLLWKEHSSLRSTEDLTLLWFSSKSFIVHLVLKDLLRPRFKRRCTTEMQEMLENKIYIFTVLCKGEACPCCAFMSVAANEGRFGIPRLTTSMTFVDHINFDNIDGDISKW